MLVDAFDLDFVFIDKQEPPLPDDPVQQNSAANQNAAGGRGAVIDQPVSPTDDDDNDDDDNDNNDDDDDDFDLDHHDLSTSDFIIMQSSFECESTNIFIATFVYIYWEI